ncbi:imelysin family protein [Aestuariivirga sp.]|uniref:imelysin family protein n=1 Tax=Aestuariivirga sp. TaxID=2650926 RepID=UPI0035941C3E
MIRTILAALLVVASGSAAAQANPRTDYVFERIVTEVVVPGFKSLETAARAHESAWTAYCTEPSAVGRDRLDASFHEVADRWASAEMMRTGPASEDFRHERFYFWPERKNAVERALAAAMNGEDGAPFTARRIGGESAALQGLPALERLLFGNGTDRPGLSGEGEGKRRCELGSAIAGNAARLASEMNSGWEKRSGDISAEAKASLATDLVTAFAIIKDTKIEAVIGDTEADVKPRAAEFWRSGRSMRDIVLNLETMGRVNAILFEVLPEEVALPAATQTAIDIARSITGNLADLAAGPERSSAILLRDSVDAAQDRAAIEVPAALGVTVGFNSLDGD